jgi:hypothetical protein
MIVYRGEERKVRTRAALAEIAGAARDERGKPGAPHENVRDLLIRFGEFEAGVMDRESAKADSDGERGRTFRRAAVALGRWFAESWLGSGGRAAAEEFLAALDGIAGSVLPEEIVTAVPEGYAHYGLYPESYVDAARRLHAERRPEQAWVIGIRSIGTSLSAAVAGTLETLGTRTESWTVRPRGHPFDRRLTVSEDLRGRWRMRSAAGVFAIVDEGPGLSGSSFVSAVDALAECGVPAGRMVLFPGWEGDAGRLVNERARGVWPGLAKYPAGMFEPAFARGAADLSAGRWRDVLFPEMRGKPAAQPQHEARKYLRGGRRMYKFAGLGRYGKGKFERARALGEAGYSPRALSLDAGFLEYDFAAGRPMAGAEVSAGFLERAADYLAFRGREFGEAARAVRFETMLEMIAVNVREALGDEAGGFAEGLRVYEREYGERPAGHVDNRAMPHEWIVTGGGWMKADSVDHSSDHFFPGEADPAWDLAALAVEFRLPRDGREFLRERYRGVSGDRVSRGLLYFYEAAYLAYRLGYCGMAAAATRGSVDAERFAALRRAYGRALEEHRAAKEGEGVVDGRSRNVMERAEQPVALGFRDRSGVGDVRGNGEYRRGGDSGRERGLAESFGRHLAD